MPRVAEAKAVVTRPVCMWLCSGLKRCRLFQGHSGTGRPSAYTSAACTSPLSDRRNPSVNFVNCSTARHPGVFLSESRLAMHATLTTWFGDSHVNRHLLESNQLMAAKPVNWPS